MMWRNYGVFAAALACSLAILTLCSASRDTDPLDCFEDSRLIGVTPPTSKTRCRPQDKAALLAFKKGISSDPNAVLSDWNTTSDCCSWTGVTCDGTTSRVVSLDLSSSRLHGVISPGLSGLSKLQVLKLYDNYFTGKLPPSLGSLSELRKFCVYGTRVTGTIPDSYFSGLSNLLNLDLSSNQLSGLLPSGIGGMSTLKKLELNNNHFTGAIPAAFGKLSSLYYADLSSNGFSGEIPAGFNDNLTSLMFILLDNNKITTFPTNLSNLKNLQYVSLIGNPIKNAENLAGLATVPKLAQLDLSHCQLTGAFPAWILSRYPRTDPALISDDIMAYLNLAYNALSGPIPTNIGSALPDYLEELNLNNNRFSGPIPSSLSKITSLKYFNVSNNRLSGQIPQVAPLNSSDASAYKGNSGLCGSPLPACKH